MIKELEDRIRNSQDEFFGQLQRWLENHDQMGSEDRMRHWKRLQDLQKNIITQVMILREHSLIKSKDALERAIPKDLKDRLNEHKYEDDDETIAPW
tara:strand:- start:1620 stop:1907 length:288 start_codon:yes stop_codon:yes gene_type:complete